MTAPCDGFTLEQDVALLAVLKQVGAAQDGGFPGTGRPDQRHNITGFGGDVDTFDDFQIAIAFVEVSDLDYRWVYVSHIQAVLLLLVKAISRKK